MSADASDRRILTGGKTAFPLAVKVVWTIWVLVWFPFYLSFYGPQNFLWFCDIANILIGVGLWLESPFIFSWQAVSVLLVQILFTVDIAGRLIFGFHPIGGSEYMFDPAYPLHIRLLSLFHVATPVVLAIGIGKLGYSRRAFLVQTATSWVVLPICYFFTSPDKDINWIFGPFDKKQDVLPPLLYFLSCLVTFPILIYLPTHLTLLRFARRPRSSGLSGGHPA